MRVRRFNAETDYPVIRTWWEARGGEAPALALLPDCGIVVEQFDNPIACAFMYEVTSGSIALIEWEATNPDIHSPITQVKALSMVFDFFEKYCRDRGIAVLLSWVASNRGDGRLLEKRKWVKCPGERHEMMAFSTQPQEALCQ